MWKIPMWGKTHGERGEKLHYKGKNDVVQVHIILSFLSLLASWLEVVGNGSPPPSLLSKVSPECMLNGCITFVSL